MNMLEHYIKEIHSVEPYNAEWTKKFDKDFVEVKVTVDCYGSIETKKRVFNTDEWEQVKMQGYFMS